MRPWSSPGAFEGRGHDSPERIYERRAWNLVASREGAQAGSVDLLRDGVVSRGVLADVTAVDGRWLESGEGGTPEDLEAPVNPIALF